MKNTDNRIVAGGASEVAQLAQQLNRTIISKPSPLNTQVGDLEQLSPSLPEMFLFHKLCLPWTFATYLNPLFGSVLAKWLYV